MRSGICLLRIGTSFERHEIRNRIFKETYQDKKCFKDIEECPGTLIVVGLDTFANDLNDGREKSLEGFLQNFLAFPFRNIGVVSLTISSLSPESMYCAMTPKVL